MIISFSNTCNLSPALSIDEVLLERLECHKVFGLHLQSNLKWNTFIEYITNYISKASKRLQILRVLKRNGVTITELLSVHKLKPLFALYWSIAPRCGTFLFKLSYQMKLKWSRNVLSEFFNLKSF